MLICLALAASADDIQERTVNDGQLILQGVPAIPADMVARVEQYQNVRAAYFLDWTRDGSGLFIGTRFGEVNQLHRVYGPGGTRQQLTWYPEPIGQVARRPGTNDLAITMDEGGGERDQIFLFAADSGSTRRLSDGSARNRLLRWSLDGRLLAFQSTRRNGRSNDLWMVEPDRQESARLLLEAPPGSWYGPADFSDDGRQLLVQEFLDVLDSRIHVLDLETMQMRLLAGDPANPSANRAITFDRRGTGYRHQ